MKIYSVDINECDYDEWDSFVIVANSKEEAKKLIVERVYSDQKTEFSEAKYFVEGVYTGKSKKPFIMCESYNAG